MQYMYNIKKVAIQSPKMRTKKYLSLSVLFLFYTRIYLAKFLNLDLHVNQGRFFKAALALILCFSLCSSVSLFI